MSHEVLDRTMDTPILTLDVLCIFIFIFLFITRVQEIPMARHLGVLYKRFASVLEAWTELWGARQGDKFNGRLVLEITYNTGMSRMRVEKAGGKGKKTAVSGVGVGGVSHLFFFFFLHQ